MNKILQTATAIALSFFPILTVAQAPPLGTVADFVLFSTDGAVTNTGLSQLTGNVGTNNGPITNFGNVDGLMQGATSTTAGAASDLTIAYNFLDAAIPTYFPAPLLGNGTVWTPGIYSVAQTATLDNTLTLDAQGNGNAIFIIQIEGAFSSTSGSQIILANGAQACNVFWKIEGLVNLATNLNDNSIFKGTVIGNNGAVILNTGVAIEGRVLSTTGAISTFAINATMTPGCEALGIKDYVLPTAKFYPNPFSSSFTVGVDNGFQDNSSELAVYNSVGSIVLQKKLTDTTNTISTSLPSGVYYYKLLSDSGKVQTGKLVAK